MGVTNWAAHSNPPATLLRANVGRRLVILGDSINGGATEGIGLADGAAVISGGILTVTYAGHGLSIGSKVVILQTLTDDFNSTPRFVSSVPNGNTFTVPAPGFADQTLVRQGASYPVLLVVMRGGKTQTQFHWLRALIRGGFDVVGNHAQNGTVSGPYAGEGSPVRNMTYVANKVLPYYVGVADYLCITAGSNDAGALTPLKTYTNLYNIGLLAITLGIVPIIMTPTPMGSGAVGYTASVPGWMAQLRNLLLDLGRKDARFKIIDMYAVAVDPLSATGNYKITGGNYHADSVHQSQHGSYKIAKALKPQWNLIFPDLDVAPGCIADVVTNANGQNLMLNPMLVTATGGSLLNSGGTGPAPTGPVAANFVVNNLTAGTGFVSITCTVPARADGYGNDQQVVIVSNSGGSCRISQSSLHTNAVAGQWYKIGCEVTISGVTALTNMMLQAIFTSSALGNPSSSTLQNSAASPYAALATETLYLETPPVQCPPSGKTGGELRLDLLLGASGGATVLMGRPYMVPCDAPT